MRSAAGCPGAPGTVPGAAEQVQHQPENLVTCTALDLICALQQPGPGVQDRAGPVQGGE